MTKDSKCYILVKSSPEGNRPKYRLEGASWWGTRGGKLQWKHWGDHHDVASAKKEIKDQHEYKSDTPMRIVHNKSNKVVYQHLGSTAGGKRIQDKDFDKDLKRAVKKTDLNKVRDQLRSEGNRQGMHYFVDKRSDHIRLKISDHHKGVPGMKHFHHDSIMTTPFGNSAPVPHTSWFFDHKGNNLKDVPKKVSKTKYKGIDKDWMQGQKTSAYKQLAASDKKYKAYQMSKVTNPAIAKDEDRLPKPSSGSLTNIKKMTHWLKAARDEKDPSLKKEHLEAANYHARKAMSLDGNARPHVDKHFKAHGFTSRHTKAGHYSNIARDIDEMVNNPHWHLQQSAKYLQAAQGAKEIGEKKFNLAMSRYHSGRVQQVREAQVVKPGKSFDVKEPKISAEQVKKIGNKLGIEWDGVSFKQLLTGANVELEHGSKISKDTNITQNDPMKSVKIAWAHLKEIPDYYSRLTKLEKQAEKEGMKNK